MICDLRLRGLPNAHLTPIRSDLPAVSIVRSTITGSLFGYPIPTVPFILSEYLLLIWCALIHDAIPIAGCVLFSLPILDPAIDCDALPPLAALALPFLNLVVGCDALSLRLAFKHIHCKIIFMHLQRQNEETNFSSITIRVHFHIHTVSSRLNAFT